MATLAAPASAAAQAYTAAAFSCAAFHQSVDGTVRTELNGHLRLERTGRSGRLLLAAEPGTGDVRLRLWWDSLTVWREADGLRTAPETDGMLGGRYVGVLGARGGWTPSQLPFIPDDIAAIADLTGVPDDLLPPLPPAPLAVGGHWTDTSGTSLTRLRDSVVAGKRWLRYAVTRRSDHEEERNIGGSRPARVSDTDVETGTLTWDPATGPWRWVRNVVAETKIVADPTRAFRSGLDQRIVLQRVAVDPAECVTR